MGALRLCREAPIAIDEAAENKLEGTWTDRTRCSRHAPRIGSSVSRLLMKLSKLTPSPKRPSARFVVRVSSAEIAKTTIERESCARFVLMNAEFAFRFNAMVGCNLLLRPFAASDVDAYRLRSLE